MCKEKLMDKKIENEALDAVELFKQELKARREGLKAIKLYRDEIAEIEEGWKKKRWEMEGVIEALETEVSTMVSPFVKLGRTRK